MLYSEIFALFSQIRTKHINTLCGQKVEFLDFKPGGTYSNHWDLKRYIKEKGFQNETWIVKNFIAK